ncbi:hypothetical protein L510_0560 [Bordetella bronchiseptica MBORD591]|nr:hypothetical protein L510_0560 [Bordetella bronchiseptica MBORD591]
MAEPLQRTRPEQDGSDPRTIDLSGVDHALLQRCPSGGKGGCGVFM